MVRFFSARARRAIACAFISLGAAACAVLGAAGGASAAQHATLRGPLGVPVRSSVDARFAQGLASGTLPVIYVSNKVNPGSVVAYPANMTTLPVAPLETIGNLNQPGALAVDCRGNLYVSEFGTNLIKMYAPASATPSEVLTVPLMGQGLRDLVVDCRGNVYVTVANFNPAGGGVVIVFLKGATQPSYTLTDSSIAQPFNLAVDASGNVFLQYLGTDGRLAVGVFPAATTLGPAPLGFNFFHRLTIDVGTNSPAVNSIGIDKNGDLLVLDGANVVSIYPRDSQTVATTFPIAGAQAFPVLRLTGPHNRHLFVPTLGSNVFDEYAYPSGTPEAHFALPGSPTIIGGLAISPVPPLGSW